MYPLPLNNFEESMPCQIYIRLVLTHFRFRQAETLTNFVQPRLLIIDFFEIIHHLHQVLRALRGQYRTNHHSIVKKLRETSRSTIQNIFVLSANKVHSNFLGHHFVQQFVDSPGGHRFQMIFSQFRLHFNRLLNVLEDRIS